MSFSAVPIFCEDIREEVSGLYTIVGALPDQMALPQRLEGLSPPIIVPKLACLIRANFLRLSAILSVDGVDHMIGAVNVLESTASEQPALQSQNAS
jgi:hypothetical protein